MRTPSAVPLPGHVESPLARNLPAVPAALDGANKKEGKVSRAVTAGGGGGGGSAPLFELLQLEIRSSLCGLRTGSRQPGERAPVRWGSLVDRNRAERTTSPLLLPWLDFFSLGPHCSPCGKNKPKWTFVDYFSHQPT